MQTDGSYVRCVPGSEEPRSAQEALLRQLSASTVAAHAQLLLDDILVRQEWLE